MSIVIKEASEKDIPAISELFDLYRQFYEQEANCQLAHDFITERLAKRESVILVAQDDKSSLVGFCQLYPTFCSVEAKPIFVLYDLFVLPSARKCGVGKRLLLAAETKAAQVGKVRMDLTTAKTNTTAQALYESLGWVRDEIFLTYTRKVAQV